MTPPNPPGGYGAYKTTYSPADATTATPGQVQADGTPCAARNSGVRCAQSTPYTLTPSPASAATSAAYNGYGQKTSSTDGGGHTTTYSYFQPGALTFGGTDEEGLLAKVTDPAGHDVLFGYDAAGDLIRTYDRNTTTTIGFDQATSTRYAQTLYGPTPAGMPWRYVTATRDPLGNTTTLTVDANGDVTASADPLGHTTTHSYDPAGDLW